MKDEGLSSSRLAEILEIQPSGISHLLSGRNKPGFDLLQKMLRRFPRINPDWLLLDSDQMYRDTEVSPEEPKESDAKTPVSIGESDLFAIEGPSSAPESSDRSDPSDAAAERALASIGKHARNDVERIVLFYADHTFDSFVAKK